MKLLVAGSRAGVARDDVWDFLDDWVEEHGRPDVVIHGACEGVDTHADGWAKARGITTDPHPARWKVDGKLDRSAGPKRNGVMAKLATHAVVFMVTGAKNKGSRDMARKAVAAGIPVHIHEVPWSWAVTLGEVAT